jgi:hypothetical protein
MQLARIDPEDARVHQRRYDRGTDAYAGADRWDSSPRLQGLPQRADRLAMVQHYRSHALAYGGGRERRPGAHEPVQVGPISRGRASGEVERHLRNGAEGHNASLVYRPLHPSASLSSKDASQLCAWANS